MAYLIDGTSLDLHTLVRLANDTTTKVEISSGALNKMAHSRTVLDTLIEGGATVYGVNTNMGGMVRWLIPPEKAADVQQNLINSVASNVGEYVQAKVVRAAILSRINSLAKGHSAISMKVFNALVRLYNKNVVPCVPSLGSLGTSGDLGPLAAVALVLTGHGKAFVEGQKLPGLEALRKVGLEPVPLSYKDGLALINGTSFMVAMLAFALVDARNLLNNYLLVTTLSFGALGAKNKPINPAVHALKDHTGQQHIAEELYKLITEMPGVQSESELSERLAGERLTKATEGTDAVEDCYSLRCTPQILGPVWESINLAEAWITRELNSASDNPLIDLEAGEIYHCGHFHGQYIAMASDHLKISMATLANIADRRIDRLLDQKKNGQLAPFLAVKDAGNRLGLMGVQFLSSSLTSEIRANATPVSIQSLPSTGDFQDIVSLGFVAARQAYDVVQKCGYVLGAEFFLGCHAVDQKHLNAMPNQVSELYRLYRTRYPYLDADRESTGELEYAKVVMLSQLPAETTEGA